MKSFSKEFWVGSLVLLVIALLGIFAWLMGAVGPFVHESRYTLLYAFAGGVEVGAPVRVAGVKVGKVERIDFLSGPIGPGDRAALRLTISVANKATEAIRRDSRFYINMAGLIGERYIEVSPGSASAPKLESGSEVRGVDPPRIDQLLSQGYGLFGKVQDFLEQNEDTVRDFLDEVTQLMTDANRLLKGEDKRKFFALVDNLNEITSDVKSVTKGLKDERTKAFVQELFRIVHRADEVDHAELKKFLQEEGIRAHLF